MFRNFLKMEENFRKVEIFLQADDFPHVQITFYASKSKSIMSRLNKKSTPIICSILGFEPRFQRMKLHLVN